MKYLLVGGIGRGSNIGSDGGLAEIFDVIQHGRLLHTINDLAVLPAADTAYVGGDPGIDDDVFFSGVFIWC